MSSFIGHSITAGAVYLARREPKQDFSLKGFLWLVCLGLAAIAPDLDYFIPLLNKANNGGIRISNSFAYSMIIPGIVCVTMLVMRVPKEKFRLRATQIFLAGLSHIILDYLVGVHPSPLFWPLSSTTYTSPIGILPSAGALSLTNFYFYRNLGIELGVLVPIYIALLLHTWRYPKNIHSRVILSFFLVVTSAVFVSIAISLTR